jgi:nucleotide-binding universal stress UspA family protein
MFQRILVPLDGSTLAESAVPIAARIAQASGGSVILLQAAIIPIEIASEKKPAEIYSQEVFDKGIVSAASYLEGVAKSEVLAGTKAETEVVTGAAAPSILSAVQSFRPTWSFCVAMVIQASSAGRWAAWPTSWCNQR